MQVDPTNPERDRFGAPWPPLLGTPLRVSTDAQDGVWSDLDPTTISRGLVERVAFLRHGTTSGRGSIALLVRLDDGRVVVAETTYRLAYAAALAIGASPAAAEEVV